MDKFKKSITFIIVTYRSQNVIHRCIKSINSKIKIIVIENSNNFSIKQDLEKKYSNVQVVMSRKNLGYGRGNNLGLKKVKTQYAFIISPDAYLDKNTLPEIKKSIDLLNDNFSIIAPNLKNNFGYFSKKQINKISNKFFFQVDYVEGFAMLLNLKKIKFNNFFDEKIFLFLEEIDLCKRIIDSGGKIYIINRAKVYHLTRKSSGEDLEIDLCRNWHWMWSLFYYNTKHFGLFKGYSTTLDKLISSLYKFILATLFFNSKKGKIYLYRILGLINAYQGNRSWLRPYIKK
jgi:N-acetylglucosaminyl-diphospho-decaprenol L-rhamnosyltransferase